MNRSNRSWLLERDGTIPLYRQIEQQLRQRISNGEWPVGTRLPSQRKLAEQFGVNRSTITQALDELASWGMVEGNKGGGTRVVNNTWNRLAAATIDWTAMWSLELISRIYQRFAKSMRRNMIQASSVPGRESRGLTCCQRNVYAAF